MPEWLKENLEAELIRLRSENRRLQKENQALRQELGPVARDVALAEDDTGQVNGVTNQSSVDEKTRLFRSLFRGREDVYPVRWKNQKGRAGYRTPSTSRLDSCTGKSPGLKRACALG